MWLGKQILFAKSEEEYKENENFEVDELSSIYLPLTLKEPKIHKKRIRIRWDLKEKPSFNFKEELVILSVFVTIVLIFIFDPFT